jgi:peptide/nickel transport system substrate-binding protein
MRLGNTTHVRRITVGIAIFAAAAVVLAACGTGSASKATTAATASPSRGGDVTVLENSGLTGSWPTGLDPATNTTGLYNQSMMDAVYGNLFELGTGGKTIYDLATGTKVSNGGKTVAIDLRKGVKFSDGTAFNAAAVKFNFDRDLKFTASTDTPTWPVTSITTPDNYTVDINLSKPFSPLIDTFHDSNVNWIASPTALKKLGEQQFLLTPVGAGPFTVVKDTLSTELDLKKNPTYWEPGKPYLNTLTFRAVAGDQAAYEDMLSGQGQVYEGMQTASLVSGFQSKFTVTDVSGTAIYVIQLNTSIPPFNNIKAREAIYYATDTKSLNDKLFGPGRPVVQSFMGPGGLFAEPTVPGYRTYNLAKAKATVKSLGGLDVISQGSGAGSTLENLTEGLKSQWQAAGINTTIKPAVGLSAAMDAFQSGKWQVFVQTAGAFDPAAGLGVGVRFLSSSFESGIHDPKLDALFAKATEVQSDSARKAVYKQAAKYISDNALAPLLFPVPGWNIAAKNLTGQGLTTVIPASAVRPEVLWETVAQSK